MSVHDNPSHAHDSGSSSRDAVGARDGGAEGAPAEGPPLLSRHQGRVALLILNRPRRLNAVTLEMYRLLEDALSAAEESRAVRVVVLSGAGRAFCVGADLKAHGRDPPGPEARRPYVEAGQRANRRLQTSPLPVVAAVNGHAIGAGLEMALSADLVVVSRDAKLRFPEVALGTFFGGGVTYTLPERVGRARARELLLLADFFSGVEAEGWGLANRAVDGADVLPTALEMAETLAGHAPLSLKLAKRFLDRAGLVVREEALDAEAEALIRCMGTRDWEEGIQAFHEGRAPRFEGE